MELRELWLLRHADADSAGKYLYDIDRPLSERGKQDVVRLGSWMKQKQLLPDHIISSPAKRARQTVIRLCSKLEIDPDSVHYDVQLYLASRGTLLEVIGATGLACLKLLVVGHNPGLEELLKYLCTAPEAKPVQDIRLATASLVRIQLPDAWTWLQQGSGKLLAITHPDQIA